MLDLCDIFSCQAQTSEVIRKLLLFSVVYRVLFKKILFLFVFLFCYSVPSVDTDTAVVSNFFTLYAKDRSDSNLIRVKQVLS